MTKGVRHLTVSPGLTAAVLAVTLSAAGCVSKPMLVPHVYTIDPPAARASAAPGGVILALKRVDVEPPYSGEQFIYRTGNHAIERDPYAKFASPPGWLLATAIRGYLANADFVRDVVSIGEGLPAQASVEVSVSEIAGDLRTDGPSAVLALTFRVLSEPQSPDVNPELFLKTYTKSVPIPRRAAKDVVEGWNKGLELIMAEFLADLKSNLVQTSILE
jgi:ABC-type transport auxiliary lipoprotein component